MSDKITETAQKVLEERYFLKGETKWDDVALRVANCFGKGEEENLKFYLMMKELDGLPNSPALMNAGTEIKSYSACYVLPVEDSIESIFKYYSDAGLISKSGGGVGANFSSIRSAGSTVHSTDGVASGPISFIRGQDALTEVIKQGGRRRGANMGVLDVDHPDVMKFIEAKDTKGVLTNFNLSVNLTDEFMQSVTQNYDVDDFENAGVAEDQVSSDKLIWKEIIKRAWSSAEPGVLFGDVAERQNTVPHLGKLNATNPCGEQWLLPYESCTLGSINLSNHVKRGSPRSGVWKDYVDYDKLRETTTTMTLLLNRILDNSEFTVPECQGAMEQTRKIGVGIMGLHDMLIQLGLPYDSDGGREVAGEVMQFVANCADQESNRLGAEDGVYLGCVRFPNGGGKQSPYRRNANLTTIAPTGTLSMIADCSSGPEPYYAPITYKTVLDGKTFVMPNKWLPERVRQTLELHDYVKLEDLDGEDFDFQVFKGAEDIHWEDHVKMQATLQVHVDSSISKTINMPNNSTIEDVENAYKLAWKSGCKGITIYRDGSRDTQILSTTETPKGVGQLEADEASLRGDSGLRVGLVDEGIPTTINYIPTPYKMDLPDELNSRRYRLRDEKNQKIYFNVCTVDDQPVEVFAKGSEEVSGSYWNTICRLLSLCMRYNIPLDDIKKQLRKSSDSVSDMPSRLARILDKYDVEPEWGMSIPKQMKALQEGLDVETKKMSLVDKMKELNDVLDEANVPLEERGLTNRDSTGCLECGNSLTPGGGCMTCTACGWSKCS